MVRVFKCHSFASQHVIPMVKEPLTICADGDKIFVATNDCEIIVFQISDGTSTETQRCPTISQVEKIVYNSFRSYIVTIELKRSWKRLTKSVRVYLNWETSTPGSTKPRTKVRVAGKSHVQHVSSLSKTELMEIVEVPLDENATSVAVCRYTGNFAVACGSEVKLCSVVEKTVANSDKTYLDVEVFLELCWNFQVLSMSLCEEFVICCSQKEVQGIRVRYDEGERKQMKRLPSSLSHTLGIRTLNNSDQELLNASRYSENDYMQPYHNESFSYVDQVIDERDGTLYSPIEPNVQDFKPLRRRNSDTCTSLKDFSVVGMRPSRQQSSASSNSLHGETPVTSVVDDEHFVEWNFQQDGASVGGPSICLPGLHSDSTLSQCYHHAHIISPPVLSDFSGGKVKYISGVQAETVLHLSDPQEKEEWNNIILIPSYNSVQTTLMRIPSVSTDRMRSVSRSLRTNMCCYVSGTRGGYLYQISPNLTRLSSYKYTDKALQVGVSQSYLHIVTRIGIETYTSRWATASLEVQEKDAGEQDIKQTHPPSSLDVCLCGHEPFFGAVNLSVGTDFLALLSKVEDLPSSEVHWGLYILHTFSLVDLYKDMISFAGKIKITGPASYIHLLQEAHLLLSTNPLYTVIKDTEVKDCYHQVCRLLGEYYSQPGQEDWTLSWPYYASSETSVQNIVMAAVKQAEQMTDQEFGKGLIDCLDHLLFTSDECTNLPAETCDAVLNIYAVSAPEKLSQVILLSNMKSYSAETAFRHLSMWLSMKASSTQSLSTVDKLAMVQLHLIRCEVDDACSELNSIAKSSLIDMCSSNPGLVHDNFSTFTPLSQLMRQHMSGTLLDILVDMIDRSIMSLKNLLILLKSQSDLAYNNHIREVLELILSDEKRTLLFEEAAQMLCEIYITKLKEKSQLTQKQITALTHQQFSLPQGNGHFAPRFAWLDYLPPFQGPNKMTKPCQRLEVKHIPGQGLRSVSLPITMVTKQVHKESCQCFVCNENLLKLQSLLCSSYLTSELASSMIHLIDNCCKEDHGKITDTNEECWDSVRLLCLINLNLDKAVEQIVDKYPSIAGMFAASCFSGNVDKYVHLLRSMELVMKSGDVSSTPHREEIYVKAYKDLLSRMAVLFPPATFLELLPADGNLYFLLPYLCTSLKLNQTNKLKQTIVDMGKDLVSHN